MSDEKFKKLTEHSEYGTNRIVAEREKTVDFVNKAWYNKFGK